MSLKAAAEHSVLLSAVLFLFLVCRSRMPLTAMLCLIIFWRLRTKDRSWIIVTAVFIMLLIPRWNSQYPEISEGRVVSLSRNYAEIKNGRTKVIMYTDKLPVLDSYVSFDPVFSKISSGSGFYSFDFQKYCSQKGIRYSCRSNNWIQVRDSHTVRGYLQKRIRKINDAETRSITALVLLGIRSDETGFRSLLNDSGISCASFLALLNYVLKYFMFEDKRKNTVFAAAVLLGIIYHFPCILVLRIIFSILDRTGLASQQKTGMGLSIAMMIFPHAAFSASFLIPAVFRYAGCFSVQKKTASLYLGMIVQSVLFHAVNPGEMLLWPLIYPGMGFMWLTALLQTVSGWHRAAPFLIFDRIMTVFSYTRITGSILGFGLPFYVLLCISVIQSEYHLQIWTAFFLFFQIFGLFHPLAEITFINVGQGDCILIREPLNTENYLIDTGRPSALDSVETYLDARGIRKINTLFITHADSDHSGNMEYIAEKYKAETVTEHQKIYQNGRQIFYDLNEIDDDDENRSSLVHFLTLNGLDILLTGDADEQTERQIIRKYNNVDCDILKLSHHGSRTGTSEVFLDAVRPELAVVSAGSYSLYHHPHPEVTGRLETRHIPYLTTRTEGDISVICFPFFNLVLTSNGTFSFIRHSVIS
ncbi:MAG: MBL fold metallo-hydrolase [Solobacterium sp.]|nr:MBL fold metallo-hydrolase [Solobacterium sp.]